MLEDLTCDDIFHRYDGHKSYNQNYTDVVTLLASKVSNASILAHILNCHTVSDEILNNLNNFNKKDYLCHMLSQLLTDKEFFNLVLEFTRRFPEQPSRLKHKNLAVHLIQHLKTVNPDGYDLLQHLLETEKTNCSNNNGYVNNLISDHTILRSIVSLAALHYQGWCAFEKGLISIVHSHGNTGFQRANNLLRNVKISVDFSHLCNILLAHLCRVEHSIVGIARYGRLNAHSLDTFLLREIQANPGCITNCSLASFDLTNEASRKRARHDVVIALCNSLQVPEDHQSSLKAIGSYVK